MLRKNELEIPCSRSGLVKPLVAPKFTKIALTRPIGTLRDLHRIFQDNLLHFWIRHAHIWPIEKDSASY
jgi:hypothetical protein